MKLDIDYTLNYWDGPIEFFGALDNEPIYALLMSDHVHDEPRVFHYWKINARWLTLARALSLPPSGSFRSDEVEPQV